MSTFDFQPSSIAPFQFQPTLDGQQYTAVVTWNVFGKRYYVSLYTLGGGRVFTLPLIGSPAGIEIQSLSWAAGIVTATLAESSVTKEHEVGETLEVSILGATPPGYNGQFRVLIVAPNVVTYPLVDYPGTVVSAGTINQIVNLAAGYFSNSIFVYRAANGQFEISP